MLRHDELAEQAHGALARIVVADLPAKRYSVWLHTLAHSPAAYSVKSNMLASRCATNTVCG